MKKIPIKVCLKYIVFRLSVCMFFTMKIHYPIMKKDIVIEFSMQVYHTRVYKMKIFQNYIIIVRFEITAIKQLFYGILLMFSKRILKWLYFCMELKYLNSNIKTNNIILNRIGFQTIEILMSKAVKIQQVCYFTYFLRALSIKFLGVSSPIWLKTRYHFLCNYCGHVLNS